MELTCIKKMTPKICHCLSLLGSTFGSSQGIDHAIRERTSEWDMCGAIRIESFQKIELRLKPSHHHRHYILGELNIHALAPLR